MCEQSVSREEEVILMANSDTDAELIIPFEEDLKLVGPGIYANDTGMKLLEHKPAEKNPFAGFFDDDVYLDAGVEPDYMSAHYIQKEFHISNLNIIIFGHKEQHPKISENWCMSVVHTNPKLKDNILLNTGICDSRHEMFEKARDIVFDLKKVFRYVLH